MQETSVHKPSSTESEGKSKGSYPNNQSLTASFVAMLCSLHSIPTMLLCNTLQNVGEKHDKAYREPYHAITNQHLVLSAKRTGTQRRTKVSP